MARYVDLSHDITDGMQTYPGLPAPRTATVLSREHPPTVVYVGLAMSVCAGSSLFLTAATAGPLTQALVERAALRDARGHAVRFGFVEFLPVGVLGFAVILGVALVLALSGALA